MRIFFRKLLFFSLLTIFLANGTYRALKQLVPHIDYRISVFNLKWNGLRKNHYNVLFFGSSKAYYGINPAIIDSITGLKCFNMGTPLQSLKETFFILQYLAKEERLPQTIVIDLYLNILSEENAYCNAWFNFKQYNLLQKIEYLCSDQDWPMAANFIIPLFIYYNHIVLADFIADRAMLKKDFSNWHRNGFYSSSEVYQPINRASLDSNRIGEITQANHKYLCKIINLANNHNLNLVFCVSPIPLSSFRMLRGYKACVGNFGSLVKPYKLIDFNRTNCFAQDSLFCDYLHLNKKGAQSLSIKFSSILANY
jgi:hypothetical protein